MRMRMRKTHALAVSLMIGAAAVAAVIALNRTVSLGQNSTPTPATTIAARKVALDRAEAQIAKLQASRPALPDRPPVVQTAGPAVIYVRAPRAWNRVGETEHGDDDEHGDETETERGEEGWDD
jgi:hypothetical protein